ncbi:MAG: dihydropteroate synthase [Myxococcales bacterium]
MQGLPPTVFGDSERARGSALLYSPREQLRTLSQAMSGPLAELGRLLAEALERTSKAPAPMTIGKRTFEWGSRTYLMGVINVTPDSFSDGGKHATLDAAVAAGERLAAEGVDLIDVGGESTRPGSEPVPVDLEIARVVPVVERLAKVVDVPISVDTTKARVMEEAARAGAACANDISGLTFDPEMASTCARLGLPVCLMHIRGVPRTMQAAPTYLDLVGEVIEGLKASMDIALRHGLPAEKLVIDPGLGFGKTAEHNLFLLRNLSQLRALGRPILVGASRKSFIGKLTGRSVGDRLSGSLAVLASAVLAGADLVRVHDVAESKVAAQVADAIARAKEGGLAFAP